MAALVSENSGSLSTERYCVRAAATGSAAALIHLPSPSTQGRPSCYLLWKRHPEQTTKYGRPSRSPKIVTHTSPQHDRRTPKPRRSNEDLQQSPLSPRHAARNESTCRPFCVPLPPFNSNTCEEAQNSRGRSAPHVGAGPRRVQGLRRKDLRPELL